MQPPPQQGTQAGPVLAPRIVDVPQEFWKPFGQKREGFTFAKILELPGASVEFFKVEEGIKLHHHLNENHILYVLKGRAEGKVGDITAELGPGKLVVIPAGIPHRLTNLSEDPLEFILFSSPPFDAEDVQWLPDTAPAPQRQQYQQQQFSPFGYPPS